MEVHGRLMAEFAEGRAILLHGSVRGGRAQRQRLHPHFARRGSREPDILAADLAFDCTGFRPDLEQPLIASLFKRGLARPDPHRLGLAVRARRPGDRRQCGAPPGLFAIGPLCQGTLWEITAVPEIVAQADRAAQTLAAWRETEAEAELRAVGLLLNPGVNLSLWLTLPALKKPRNGGNSMPSRRPRGPAGINYV